MSKILFDNTSELDVGGLRRAVTISRTATGVSVKSVSLYADEPTTTAYYKDYPELPDAWDAAINDFGTPEFLWWLNALKAYKPYRTVK